MLQSRADPENRSKGTHVASKSPLQKLQDVVIGTVKGVVSDPVGTAGKAGKAAKGTFALGRMVAGQVTHKAAEVATHRAGRGAGVAAATATGVVPAPRTEARRETVTTPTPTLAAEQSGAGRAAEVSPTDVARVVAKKSPAEKAAAREAATKKAAATKAAKKAAAARAASAPGAKLPVSRTATEKSVSTAAPEKPAATKAPATKAPAKKTTAKKTTAKKTTAKKTTAKKADARPRSAAEVLDDSATEVTTPAGTTGADVATNPDTTDTDLQQPGTAPLMDPATTKAVASEATRGARAADPGKA